MKFPSKKHSQFELFPGSLGRAEKGHKRFSLNPIKMTWENAVICMIIFVMGIIVSFSFGVEKGKRFYQKSIKQREIKERNIVLISDEKPIIVTTEETEDVSQESEISYKVEQKEENFIKTNTINSEKNKSIDKHYSVQVASFKYKQSADRMVGDVGRLGYEAFALPAGKYYIVCIGRFPDKDMASQMREKLLTKYPDCLIRSL